jgi:threonine dehydratase
MLTQYVEKILKAQVYDVAEETPLDVMPRLSKRLNNHILLKREDLQPVFSFKLRGAYNRMSQLSEQERARGVVSASAGNHAQGVALAAKKMGVSALIVMPTTTPAIKVESVKALGAETRLFGNSFDEAFQHAMSIVEQQGRTFIPPYDDPYVIAGQGTIAMEIMRQHSGDLHAVFVPVGGGGLIAGVAAYIKAFWPNIKVIGVEAEDSACLKAAMDAGSRVVLDQVGLFADGTAVKQIGEETFRVAQQTVDDVITVKTDEICAAIMDIFDDTRSIAEPSGALAVAGVKKYVEREAITDQQMVVIDSGANINFDRLRHVAERAELGEQREVLFATSIPEEPGSFLKFCETLGKRSITEFNYRFADKQQAQVFVGVSISGRDEKEALFTSLQQAGYQLTDLSDNEMAKLHVRYMVGGHAVEVVNESLYRFEFPELPGALLNFLSKLGQKWNITLFHYRNHGAAYGRVLIGVQVPDQQHDEFQRFLEALGYAYWKETANPAYQLFLK